MALIAPSVAEQKYWIGKEKGLVTLEKFKVSGSMSCYDSDVKYFHSVKPTIVKNLIKLDTQALTVSWYSEDEEIHGLYEITVLGVVNGFSAQTTTKLLV